MSDEYEAYHEGTDKTGMMTLIGLVLGLICIGVLMFSLTWAMAH